MSKTLNFSQSFKQTSSSNSISELSQSRIITKNLVYVIGLSQKIASKETLTKYEYFGQYGHIVKIVINKKKAYNQNNPYGPSFSAYVTYSKPSEASIAILALDDTVVDNHLIRASFGTTKYCSFYLKKMECTNKDCLFLHKKACESDIIKREDLNVNKNIFYEQQLYAIKIADIYNPEIKKKLLLGAKNKKTMFPSTDLIYKSEIVMENDPIFTKKNNYVNNNSYENSGKTKKQFTEDNSSVNVDNDINSLKEKISPNSTNKNTRNTLKLEIESIKSIRDDVTCSSTGDEKLSTSTPKERKNFIFCNREKSRFDFVKNNSFIIGGNSPQSNDNKDKNNDIPEFILEIIEKRYKIQKMAKYFKNLDLMLIKGELFQNKIDAKDQWTQFILKNSNYTFNNKNTKNKITHTTDEFITDIENINTFILKKTKICK